MHQRHVGADVVGDHGGDVVNRVGDPPAQLLGSRQLAEPVHARLGLAVEQQMWRHIAARGAEAEHANLLAVTLVDVLSHVVPEIGA